jgi:outer membrane usher protein
VVDTRAPYVPVELENRPIGTTDRHGRLLVPGLNAYQRSKLSIDVTRLPVTAIIPSTELTLAPRDRSGVTADFGISLNASSAIVVVTGPSGALLPPGTPVSLASSGEQAVAGYDGRVYLTSLDPDNDLIASLPEASCTAYFQFSAKADSQQVIGPVPCR